MAKTPKPIRFSLEGKWYVATLMEGGFLGYTSYDLIEESTRERVAGGGISRLNYASAKAHREAIRKTCVQKAAEFQAQQAKKAQVQP